MRRRTGHRARTILATRVRAGTYEGCDCANRAENGADDAVDGTDGANKGHCGEAKAATDWGTAHACHCRSGCSPCRCAVLLVGERVLERSNANVQDGACKRSTCSTQTVPHALRDMRRRAPCSVACRYAASAMKHGATGVQHPAHDAALARDAHTMRACGLSRATMQRAAQAVLVRRSILRSLRCGLSACRRRP